jgi:ketosteroid isomerase-like protein
VARRGYAQEVKGDEVRALFLGSLERYEPDCTCDVDHVIAEDHLVALHCTMHARTTIGTEYHGSYHMLFRIEDGRIAEAWEFLDTAYVFECLQPSAGPSAE